MGTHFVGTGLDRSYRHVTKPIARYLTRYSFLTPNRVTVAAFVVGGIGTPVLILTQQLWLAGIAYIISDLLDYVDGDIARALGVSSPEGDILDGTLDRYTDFATISALTILITGGQIAVQSDLVLRNVQPTHTALLVLGLLALLGSMIPSFVQAVAVANGKRTAQSVGGRGTRNRILILGLLLGQPTLLLLFLAVLGNIAGVHRLLRALEPG